MVLCEFLTGYPFCDILTPASVVGLFLRHGKSTWRGIFADVAELADALDLGSSAARRMGSSPFIRTIQALGDLRKQVFFCLCDMCVHDECILHGNSEAFCSGGFEQFSGMFF